MEKPKRGATIEEYESFLSIQLIELVPDQMKRNVWHTFAVTPNFTIYITDKFHAHLFQNYGVDPEATLTEGNVRIKEDGTVEVLFKHAMYQQSLAFKGSQEELFSLQGAIKNKITAFLAEKD